MKNVQNFDEFLNECCPPDVLINENYMDVRRAIDYDLQKFLIDVVINKSKGYVKSEKDAAALLYQVLKDTYGFGK